jgi:hypothetical protein
MTLDIQSVLDFDKVERIRSKFHKTENFTRLSKENFFFANLFF